MQLLITGPRAAHGIAAASRCWAVLCWTVLVSGCAPQNSGATRSPGVADAAASSAGKANADNADPLAPGKSGLAPGLDASDFQPAPPFGRAGYGLFAREYAIAVNAGDYTLAYSMTSSHLQRRESAAQFTARHQSQRGPKPKFPAAAEVVLNAEDFTEASRVFDEAEPLLSNVPFEDRRGMAVAAMHLPAEGESGASAQYQLRIFLAEEAGQMKVAADEYAWPTAAAPEAQAEE